MRNDIEPNRAEMYFYYHVILIFRIYDIELDFNDRIYKT